MYSIKNETKFIDHNKPIFIAEFQDSFDLINLSDV